MTTKGNIRFLKPNADHYTRSKVIHHPNVIPKKQNDITVCLQNEIRQLTANLLVNVNRDREKVLLSHVNLPVDTESTPPLFQECTLLRCYFCLVQILTAFDKMGTLIKLTEKFNIPKNGSANYALVGVVDKKTNGSTSFNCN